tara:strand:- start:203 stop:394 length:192 start_codon:yes stop_codon:yes gene_type:complete
MINALRLMSKIQDYKNELNECLRNEVYTDYGNSYDYDRPTKQDLEIAELRIKIKVCMEILQDD